MESVTNRLLKELEKTLGFRRAEHGVNGTAAEVDALYQNIWGGDPSKWFGEFISAERNMRTIRVHLTHGSHVVEFKVFLNLYIRLRVDGSKVRFSHDYEGGRISFDVVDGDHRRRASIYYDRSSWPQDIRSFQLDVERYTLYSDD